MDAANETMLVFAARYAHGRQTGAVFAVKRVLKKEWPLLSKETRKQIVQESAEGQHSREDWNEIATWSTS